MVFTASDVLLKTLIEAGITHAFVNLGSDHPSLLEAFIHLRDAGETRLEFITSPNEMVALSAAQGYAQVTGNPAAVIVHVDCGTQALAGAVHNVSTCRTPVFIYAGASPATQHGELPGSRNDAVDQPAIVRQYMRHVGEIKTGKNTQDVVLRALQFANSEPKGPVYCWATREITEELLDPKAVPDVKISQNWPAIEPAGLSPSVVKTIAEALIGAKSPLIVTSYLGRNHTAVQELIKFVDVLGIPVFSSCPSTVNIPFNHPSHAGVAYGGKIDIVENADVILILDSDIPWVPLHTTPSSTTKIFHIDCDPLKERMAMHVFPSSIRAKADSSLALEQLNDYVATKTTLSASTIADRKSRLAEIHNNKNQALLQLEQPSPDGLLTTPQIVASFRQLAPKKSLVLNEAISNYPHVWNHFAPTSPGSLLTSGASSLGWALGAAIGASLAGQTGSQHKSDLLAVFVGDGSFLFNVPASSYWMARRYETPFLTVVLNNGGWKSPRLSMLGVHPEGLGSKSTARDLNVSFGPDELNVDYGAVAAAAGGAWCKKVLKSVHLELAMKEAIKVVTEEKRGFTPPPRPASSRLAGLGCLVGLTALGVAFNPFSRASPILLEANQLEAAVKDDVRIQDLATVTIEELESHNKEDSCWVVLDGEVWDVTSFLADHPGGKAVLLKNGGGDVTELFKPTHPEGTMQRSGDFGVKRVGVVDQKALSLFKKESSATEKLASDLARQQLPPVEVVRGLKEMEDLAKSVLSTKALKYYEAGSDDWNAYYESFAAYQRCQLRPRVLVDVAEVDARTTLLGSPSPLPIYISPSGWARMGHELGEVNLTRGAAKTGIVQGISAGASMTVVDICAEAKALEANGSPKVALAYQIYMNRDRSKTEQLMNEAIEGGCKAFFVTVDTATFGNRQSDFSYQKLPGNMDGTPRTEPNRDVFGYWDASLNWKEIAWVKEKAGGRPVWIKGVQSFEDVELARQAGVTGVVLSNHGGRQMDAGVAPLDVLIEIRQRDPTLLTDLEVYVDGGVRRGTDVLKALCLGAKGVGLGRPFLYAQSAYGEDGVVRTVRIMEEEIITGMRLLGAPTLKDLKPEMVQCLDRRYTRFQ